MSFERVQHLVEIDEKIFAAFVIDRSGNISELFTAPGSELDRSKIEKVISALDIRSVAVADNETVESLLGRHKWDVLEYDKFKFIKLYPDENLNQKMIVVIAASTKDAGDVADTVIGYMNDSDQNEDPPSNLFD
ncbi:MAG: hypothetical protein GEU26_02180 [Nitrososphaeraceae archaeon]|nr:hypothetical protein [Nitrososphaeraceae archaeon]